MDRPRYRDFNTFLRERFGRRVQKVTLDAGLACPNRDGTLSTAGCVFCNARGSGTGAAARGMSVTEQLATGKAVLAARYKAKKFLAYFQSYTNTYAPLPTLTSLWDQAMADPDVAGLCVGTRPDCVPDEVLDLLAAYRSKGMVWLELGLQSAKDETLAAINRGHSAACFADAVARAKSRGLWVCAHAILGLPGETAEDMAATADFLANLGVEGVKIHLLYAVKGTELGRMVEAGRCRMLSRGEYVERVCDFLERLHPETVVQRLTGDPHPGELLAPPWCLDKRGVLADIKARLAQRDTFQGRLYSGGGSAILGPFSSSSHSPGR
ncbi:MAG: TIGR01212 family radical SAM protein [Deltaproteobacteria bacterium]|nr:TIGR01212 family radical SAM protein [Deltaproteobacteria bacterium]